MATLTANGLTLTYSNSSTDNGLTITLSSLVKNTDPTAFTTRFVKITVDGKTFVSEEARQAPSVSDILKTYTNDNGVSTATQKQQAVVERKNRQKQYGSTACAKLVSDFNSKSTSAKTFTFSRSTVDKKVILNLYVLGISTAVNITIPKKASSDSSVVVHDGSQSIGIEKVNGGLNYVVNEQAYNTYGHIERVVDFSDVKDEKQLLALAKAYVNALQFDDMCLSVSALDLHSLSGEVPGFELLDEVRCISRPHGLDRTFPITEISIPLDDPSKTTYTFGKLGGSSMSQSMAENASNVFKRINRRPSATRLLDAAKLEMSEILNRRTTGYVNIVQENDISQALVISNTEDWTHATKLWKFDMNGLGYSDSTIGSTFGSNYPNAQSVSADGRFYKLGITMDGTIVADFIKTGLLEDGYGLNYWNLATGEFQLSQNTLIDTDALDGSVSTLNDIATSLETTNENVEGSYAKEVGTKNILRKSDDFSILNVSGKTWAKGGWNTYRTTKSGVSVKIVNSASNSVNAMMPAGDLTKAVEFNHGSVAGRTSSISQSGIKVAVNTIYTLACYAAGTNGGKLRLSIRGGNYSHAKVISPLTTSWNRYNIVFKTLPANTNLDSLKSSKRTQITNLTTAKNNAYTTYKQAVSDKKSASEIKQKKAAYNTACTNLKTAQKELDVLNMSVPVKTDKTIDVTFAHAGVNKLVISGLTLVKGNISSEWHPSDNDFVDLTQSIGKDLDDKLDVKYLMNKLTQNGKKQGVYFKNGQLLINASYLMTGLITDKAQRNSWNLDRGVLTTTNMVANNIQANGILQNSNWYGRYLADIVSLTNMGLYFKHMYHLRNGHVVHSKQNAKKVVQNSAWIASGHYLDCSVYNSGHIALSSNSLSVTMKRQKGVTKSLNHKYALYGQDVILYIKGMAQDSNKKIKYTTLAKLTFTHGLLTNYALYDPTLDGLNPPGTKSVNGRPIYGLGYRRNKSGYLYGLVQ